MLAAGPSRVKENFFFMMGKITALYASTDDPVKREKPMMQKEKKTARVMALSRQEGNIIQKSTVLPQMRAWTVHLPNSRESRLYG